MSRNTFCVKSGVLMLTVLLFMLTIFTVAASGSYKGMRDKNLYRTRHADEIKVWVISGTRANSSEECENLYDGNVYTKWCVVNFSSAYVIFELSLAASVNGIKITTANDNSVYKGRNPRSFVLYGSNSFYRPSVNDRSWEVVAFNNNTYLEDVNYKTYDFNLKRESEEYKYYKLEVTETMGANVMQMSELSFVSGRYNFIP